MTFSRCLCHYGQRTRHTQVRGTGGRLGASSSERIFRSHGAGRLPNSPGSVMLPLPSSPFCCCCCYHCVCVCAQWTEGNQVLFGPPMPTGHSHKAGTGRMFITVELQNGSLEPSIIDPVCAFFCFCFSMLSALYVCRVPMFRFEFYLLQQETVFPVGGAKIRNHPVDTPRTVAGHKIAVHFRRVCVCLCVCPHSP